MSLARAMVGPGRSLVVVGSLHMSLPITYYLLSSPLSTPPSLSFPLSLLSPMAEELGRDYLICFLLRAWSRLMKIMNTKHDPITLTYNHEKSYNNIAIIMFCHHQCCFCYLAFHRLSVSQRTTETQLAIFNEFLIP